MSVGLQWDTTVRMEFKRDIVRVSYLKLKPLSFYCLTIRQIGYHKSMKVSD